jgi:hypothetical protein
VTLFLIKPHSWDLQSRRLGINRNVIILVSVLFPSMFHSLAFLLVAWSKGLQIPFWPHKVHGHFTGLNKLPHNIEHFSHDKFCSLLELWQPVNHNQNTNGTALVYKGQLINKLLSQSFSVFAFFKAIYSNSIVNLTMQVCFKDLQEIAHPNHKFS